MRYLLGLAVLVTAVSAAAQSERQGFPAPGVYKCDTPAGFHSIEITPKGQFSELTYVLTEAKKATIFMATAGRLSPSGTETLFSAEWMLTPAAVMLGDSRWKKATGFSARYQIRVRDPVSFVRLMKSAQDIDGKWESAQVKPQTCEMMKVPSTINQLQLPAEFLR